MAACEGGSRRGRRKAPPAEAASSGLRPEEAGPERAPDPPTGLVEVAKAGGRLLVHPATLHAHLAAGWRQVR
ncbi:conserved protein of unknown function [Rhodovastum atsumiense]|uniref:Uncharacterized protein n=1 Tax=Rhodovastum atsumiense TaxID=504468 RepID=A0A5M6IYN9_9PROT|nr:hypothetical protein [Rhodovastum atsumiense]KAA5613464.1 hypothetical protein F1189_05250 [Rhodovastum atsumiense]CAH2603201.1 conserved protein of unknown function [Rhodovastum atsumiense]